MVYEIPVLHRKLFRCWMSRGWTKLAARWRERHATSAEIVIVLPVPFPSSKCSFISLTLLPMVKTLPANPQKRRLLNQSDNCVPQFPSSLLSCSFIKNPRVYSRPVHNPSTTQNHDTLLFHHPRKQVLNTDEAIKGGLLLGGKSASDFALTSSEPGPHRYGDKTTSFEAAENNGAAGFAWASESTGKRISSCSTGTGESSEEVTGACSGGWGSGGPHGTGGLQKVLDAMATVGVSEGERDGLLRGLSAVLHLGQVRSAFFFFFVFWGQQGRGWEIFWWFQEPADLTLR